MMIPSPASRRDERGAVAMIVAVSATVLFLFAALVVELGLARDTRRQAQNGADAAVLAGANLLYNDLGDLDIPTAVSEIKAYALSNYGVPLTAWDTCTDAQPTGYVVPAGSTDCVSFSPNLTRPLELRVRIPNRDVDTPFGGLADVDNVTIGAVAHARVAPGGASDCGLCVIGNEFHDLQNGDATVSGADIHFNGDVRVANNGLVATDGEITVEGTAEGPLANYQPDPKTGADEITDPLAEITLPPDMTGLVARTNPCADGPGIYSSRAIRGALCTLQPGLYVIAGDDRTVWDLASNDGTRLAGTGVTLYFTCGTTAAVRACNVGEEGAWLDASGNGSIGLTAPTSGPLRGLTLVYDRNNTSELRLTGNGSSGFTGTIYAASGQLEMNGNGCSTTFNALIVVKDLEFNGNPACLRSNYDLNQNISIPRGAIFLSR